ncbi:MAG TPA: integrase [Thermoanaerobaculia bacterium]|jgi:site-specific recombinase XerD|nr:integrase [Thermoanaerobaculia bacterium]
MPPEPQDATPGPAPSASTPARAPAAPEQARRSAETARLYAMDWKTFTLWCEAAGLAALPAAPATVAGFLAAAGAANCGAGALGRRAAAIAERHRQLGLPSPAADQAVRAILRAARRAATPRRPPPRRPAQLIRMAAICPGDLAGIRDRALLLLAAAGLGRAALVGLDAEHVHFTATSVALAIRQAGPDDDGRRTVAVPRGATLATCPVQALQDWLRSSDTRFGPVFRKIDRWGTIEHRRLGTDALRRILARRTPRRSRRTRKAAA